MTPNYWNAIWKVLVYSLHFQGETNLQNCVFTCLFLTIAHTGNVKKLTGYPGDSFNAIGLKSKVSR